MLDRILLLSSHTLWPSRARMVVLGQTPASKTPIFRYNRTLTHPECATITTLPTIRWKPKSYDDRITPPRLRLPHLWQPYATEQLQSHLDLAGSRIHDASGEPDFVSRYRGTESRDYRSGLGWCGVCRQAGSRGDNVEILYK
ncbi:hypothetical protein GGS24DRAFT_13305 [Hypoxylon argillaceum]|nr:hypothetical protein GGS24DRAFT_13305 [Hypoxylon argillaceum]